MLHHQGFRQEWGMEQEKRSGTDIFEYDLLNKDEAGSGQRGLEKCKSQVRISDPGVPHLNPGVT